VRDVLKCQLRELLRRVAGNLTEHAVDAGERAVERDERHADRRFVDREAESLFRLAELRDRGLQLTASRLLCGQQPFTFVRVASRFRDVARHRAHAKEALATRVANQEVGIRHRDSFVRLEVPKERIA